MMKGLPSGYNRDFHEDKEILVEALNLINRAVDFVPELVNTTKYNLERMNELAYGNFSTATEVANFLVSKHNVPFRTAHHIVGSLVGELYRSGRNFSAWEFCLDHIANKNGIKVNAEELKKAFDPKSVMLSYKSLGGTGKEPVEKMIKDFQAQLETHKSELSVDQKRVSGALETTRSIAEKAKSVKTSKDLLNLIPHNYRTTHGKL